MPSSKKRPRRLLGAFVSSSQRPNERRKSEWKAESRALFLRSRRSAGDVRPSPHRFLLQPLQTSSRRDGRPACGSLAVDLGVNFDANRNIRSFFLFPKKASVHETAGSAGKPTSSERKLDRSLVHRRVDRPTATSFALRSGVWTGKSARFARGAADRRRF